jgi:hypothetical protein
MSALEGVPDGLVKAMQVADKSQPNFPALLLLAVSIRIAVQHVALLRCEFRYCRGTRGMVIDGINVPSQRPKKTFSHYDG